MTILADGHTAFQIALYQLYYTLILDILAKKVKEDFVIKSIEVL